MRKNLDEPKTIADFEDILEDYEFRKLWNIKNPSEAYDDSDDDRDHQSDNEIPLGQTPTTVIESTKMSILSEAMVEKYSSGAAIMEKLGYQGGVLGYKGQGPWMPLEVELQIKFSYH